MILYYNIGVWKTFGFYVTTSYDCRKVKWQFLTWTLVGFPISGWPDVRRRRIRRSLCGRRLHPHMRPYVYIGYYTVRRPCATRTNLVHADIYTIIYILYIYINIQTGVCVALKDIGRWHPLAILENNSKRREYTQIVCMSPFHSLSLTLYISLTIFILCLRLS